MTEKLKPCPFCGSPAEIRHWENDPDDDMSVCCTGCAVDVGWYADAGEGVRMWNRRAAEQLEADALSAAYMMGRSSRATAEQSPVVEAPREAAPERTAPEADMAFGKDCPKGMVQVEFVSCDPGRRRGNYGWLPTKSAFLELYVDGERFRVEVGDYPAANKSGVRRGLHICGPMNFQLDRHSINALDIFVEKEAPNVD